MKTENIKIELLERGDIILTPGGLAQVTKDEDLQDYIDAGSYYKIIKVRWLSKSSKTPRGNNVEKASCTFKWDTKEKDIENLTIKIV